MTDPNGALFKFLYIVHLLVLSEGFLIGTYDDGTISRESVCREFLLHSNVSIDIVNNLSIAYKGKRQLQLKLKGSKKKKPFPSFSFLSSFFLLLPAPIEIVNI